VPVGVHLILYYIDNPISGDDRFGGLQCFGFGGEPLLALLAFIERIDLINCALGALAQALFLKPGVGQRTHDHTPLLPSLRLARLPMADLLDGICKPNPLSLSLALAFPLRPAAPFLPPPL